jgi:hypothetical protein
MNHYQLLTNEARDLGDFIANCMDGDGLLSDAAKARLSTLNKDIAGYINDYISEVGSELAAAASHYPGD